MEGESLFNMDRKLSQIFTENPLSQLADDDLVYIVRNGQSAAILSQDLINSISDSINIGQPNQEENSILFFDSDKKIDSDPFFKWDPVKSLLLAGGGTASFGVNAIFSQNFGLNASVDAKWFFNSCESGVVALSANNGAAFGFNNIVGDGTQASGNVSFTTGVDNINNGRGLFVGGVGARSLNSGNSGGFAYAIKLGRGRRDTNIPYVTANDGSFNISRNTSDQVDGNGALALDSGILMGVNHHIPATSNKTLVLAGEGIVVPDNTTNAVFVPRLFIGKGVNATIPDAGPTDELLAVNSDGELTRAGVPGASSFWKLEGSSALTNSAEILLGSNTLELGLSGVFGLLLNQSQGSFLFPTAGSQFGVLSDSLFFVDISGQSIFSSDPISGTILNVSDRGFTTNGNDQKIMFTGGAVGFNIKNGGTDGVTSGIPSIQFNATFGDVGWGTNSNEGNNAYYFRFDSSGAFFEDKRVSKEGIKYGFSDYSALTPDSLLPREFIDGLIESQELLNYEFETANFAGGVVTLDMANAASRRFRTSITGDANIQFVNDFFKSSITIVVVTSARFNLVFGTNVVATDQIASNDWDQATGTLDLRSGAGTYILDLEFDGVNLIIKNFTETL